MIGLGRLQRSVLWHLLEEGTGTATELCRLIGCRAIHLERTLLVLRAKQLLQTTPCPPERRRSHRGKAPLLFGLTPVGIQAALVIDRDEVQFARQAQEEAEA